VFEERKLSGSFLNNMTSILKALRTQLIYPKRFHRRERERI
jgi:hypothetical protein